MTTKEAIYKLKAFRDHGDVLLVPYLIEKDKLWKEMTEAFDMAIEVLKQGCDDLISRQSVIDRLKREEKILYSPAGLKYLIRAVRDLPSVHPEAQTQMSLADNISRQDAMLKVAKVDKNKYADISDFHDACVDCLKDLPSAQPEQRYTKEELRVFQHGISLSLLSKRSAQHWRYDEDTATEIEFLERLYEKVGADMRGEHVRKSD